MMQTRTADAVQVHLKRAGALRAGLSLWLQGKLSFKKALAYTGPHFIANADVTLTVAIGAGTVNVQVWDVQVQSGAFIEYVYPLDTVARIKISIK